MDRRDIDRCGVQSTWTCDMCVSMYMCACAYSTVTERERERERERDMERERRMSRVFRCLSDGLSHVSSTLLRSGVKTMCGRGWFCHVHSKSSFSRSFTPLQSSCCVLLEHTTRGPRPAAREPARVVVCSSCLLSDGLVVSSAFVLLSCPRGPLRAQAHRLGHDERRWAHIARAAAACA